jgi:hypothetical protein
MPSKITYSSGHFSKISLDMIEKIENGNRQNFLTFFLKKKNFKSFANRKTSSGVDR